MKKQIQIVPDDVYDIRDLIDELRKWISKKSKRWTPAQMSALLIYLGSEIAFDHAVNINGALTLIDDVIHGAWSQFMNEGDRED